MPAISGIAKDASGTPCEALISAFRFDTKELVGQAVSNASTGAYSITTADTSLHIVIRQIASIAATNPNWNSTKVLVPFTGPTLKEAKGRGLTSSGVTLDDAVADPYGGTEKYGLFAGAGKVEIDNAGGILIPSGDFTARFKFRPTASSRMGLMAFGADFYFGMDYHYNGTRNINMWASSNGSSWDILQSDSGGANNGIGSISLTLNDWNDVEFTRVGSVWRSFVNGTKDREVTASGSLYAGSQPLRIGAWGNGAFFTSGCIADLELHTASPHTASFTPPSSRPLPAVAITGAPTENAQIYDYVTPM